MEKSLLIYLANFWDTLISAAEDKNAGEIVLFLDAIDKCEDYGRY